MKRENRRKGALLVLLLVGMAVAATIFFSVLKLIAVQRQTVELQTRQMQAGWLADSAVERTSARLASQAGYRGETWTVLPQDLGGLDGASIAVRVEEVPGRPDRRAIHVNADYPPDPSRRVRQSREVIVSLKGAKL